MQALGLIEFFDQTAVRVKFEMNFFQLNAQFQWIKNFKMYTSGFCKYFHGWNEILSERSFIRATFAKHK